MEQKNLFLGISPLWALFPFMGTAWDLVRLKYSFLAL